MEQTRVDHWNHFREGANTIGRQLGGHNRLKAMIGANSFGYNDEKVELRFKFKGNPNTNFVKITLNGKDLYDLTFYKLTRWDLEEVKEVNDIYAEDLIEVFEQATKLYLRL